MGDRRQEGDRTANDSCGPLFNRFLTSGTHGGSHACHKFLREIITARGSTLHTHEPI